MLTPERHLIFTRKLFIQKMRRCVPTDEPLPISFIWHPVQ